MADSDQNTALSDTLKIDSKATITFSDPELDADNSEELDFSDAEESSVTQLCKQNFPNIYCFVHILNVICEGSSAKAIWNDVKNNFLHLFGENSKQFFFCVRRFTRRKKQSFIFAIHSFLSC